MPYASNVELPAAVKSNLPSGAQSIWRAAHNAALKQYNGSEEKAAAVAWAAVKNKYQKVKGEWVAKKDTSMGKRRTEDNETGMVRASAREDIQELTIAEQDEYCAEYNQYMEEHPGATCEECDKYAREQIGADPAGSDEGYDGVADSVDVEVTETTSFDDAQLRESADGYLLAVPRVARTGIQTYKGFEIGRPDLNDVRVYRPPDQVFDKKAMSSLAWRPITLDHPPETVNSSNWREYGVGQSSGDVARDGEYIRVPMMVMDAAAISAVRNGKAQLSVGYGARLVWGDGKTPSGESYHATQTQIRANHIAIVSQARGGSALRLGDATAEDGYGDRDYSAEQRQQMAAKGQAMSHGGYPIK